MRAAARWVVAGAGLLLVVLAAGTASRAHGEGEAAPAQPPGVRAAREAAARFPLPSHELGFQFVGTGTRPDGAEVELTVRVEPAEEAGLPAWKLTEVWGAKGGGASARRMVESLVAQDLTPLRGGTYEDGTARPQRLEWLAGERVLALRLSGTGSDGKPAREARSAWFAGQPMVEVASLLLWARLAPRAPAVVQVDFGAPSWNRLGGPVQGFQGLTVEGGAGPEFRVAQPGSSEVQQVATHAWTARSADGQKVLQALVDAADGRPRMLSVYGSTYVGQALPL